MTIWRAVLSGELYGVEKWANVFHLDVAGAIDESAIGAAFVKFYVSGSGQNNVLIHCPGTVATGVVGVHLSQLSLQEVTNPGLPRLSALNNTGGQNTPGGLPLDTCLCISWRTARAGRSFRGRTYCPPFHGNRNEDANPGAPRPTTACVTGLAVAATTLITELEAASAPLVVFSRKLGTGEPITGGYVDEEWDTQRRRSRNQPKPRVTFEL